MNKKRLTFLAASSLMAAVMILPGFAKASLLPTYNSLMTMGGRGPQVLGVTSPSSDSDPIDLLFNSIIASQDTVYHLASESDVLGATTDKSSYVLGETPTLTVTGITQGGKVAIRSLKASDLLSTGVGTQLFDTGAQNANSQGSVTLKGRVFGSADAGSWLVLVVEVIQDNGVSSKPRLRMGLVRMQVGSTTLSKIQGALSDATQGVPYSGSFRITTATTSPLTFVIMNLPKGITAAVAEASNASTTQSSGGGIGNFTVIQNTPPIGGGYTVNLIGVPQDSGVYFVMSVLGSTSMPLDIDFLKFKVMASATAVIPPSGSGSLSMPGGSDNTGIPFNPDTFVGVQMPQGSLSMADQVTYTSQNVQVEGTGDNWWITDQGLKMKVPNRKIFLSYGNSDEDVVMVTQEDLDQYPNVEYIKLRGSGKVYKLEGNIKRLLSSAAKLNLEVVEEQVAEVNQAEFNFYKTGKTITK